MRYSVRTISTAAMALIATAVASAQMNTPLSGVTIRAGASFLTDSGSRDLLSNTGFTLGVGYKLPSTVIPDVSLGRLTLDFDWTRTNGNGNKLDVYGLEVVDRMPFVKTVVKGGFAPYFGLGVGVTYNNLSASRSVSNGSGGFINEDEGGNKFGIGLQALLGISLNERFDVEAAYRYNGSVSGTRTDAVTVTLGVKF